MQTRQAIEAPDRQYLDVLKDIQFRPIFILGHPRSGTTLLYKLLRATECFNVITLYHVMCYDEILSNYINHMEENARKQLRDFIVTEGLINRGIDNIEVTPGLPEQYGFILRNAGYRPRLNPRNLPVFMELCEKVQFMSSPSKPLLLKNPQDFRNFIYVKTVFPEARFVFIHRHPIHVINSQLKAIRSALEIKNPYIAALANWYNKLFDTPCRLSLARFLFSSHIDLGLRIVTHGVYTAARYFLKNVGKLPNTHYFSIRYEDLCESPDTTMLSLLRSLGVEPYPVLTYDALIAPRPVRLLPEVARKRTSICKRLEAYCTYHGYM